MNNIKAITVNAREAARESVTIRVQVKVKGLSWVRFGLFLIKVGCRISGANYVEEFPLSLLQNGKHVEMDK